MTHDTAGAGPSAPRPVRSESATGALYAVVAFAFWGLAPVYWKSVHDVASLELLTHRILWALPLLSLYVLARRRASALRAAISERRTLLSLVATSLLIAVNWLTFIIAVNTDRVLQASLGYYINPLANVLLGLLVLGERLSPRQWAAVGLATLGVVMMTIDRGSLPWIALLLAGSFALYGLVRKTVNADAITGLTFEVALCTPLAALYL